MNARILIADDEPLLRAQMRETLAQLWPNAQLVGEAEDGPGALSLANTCQPDIAFLDIRMPGLSGIDVARALSGRCHVVFVTAHDEYAVAAFEEGAVDYVLKPADPARLARTVTRLQDKINTPPADLTPLLARLTPIAQRAATWLQASVGNTIHFITLAEVIYFQAEAKYTKVVTDRLEAHIRKPIKELAAELGSDRFWQIHRGTLVAVERIAAVQRHGDAMQLLLRDHPTRLTVSQAYQHCFRSQ
ncbi:LytR/AlgR family response regulator transcription factor [Chitinolyticbacter albus]|uniref:LytR/AlgR family response regulator transcription factor n=1 Tax=Chitinolyticbacter albus TaxID=2961951 RepID=UPI00210F011C|nr:LytTR family DNA-binding domain-containing protein [Chitinolyticbacter albus]